jgi:hypothetical protein
MHMKGAVKRALTVTLVVSASGVLTLVTAQRCSMRAERKEDWRAGEFYAIAVWTMLLSYVDENGHYPDSLMALKDRYWAAMPDRPDVAYLAANQRRSARSEIMWQWGLLLLEETRDDTYSPFRRGRFVVLEGGARWIPSGGHSDDGLTELHVAAIAGRSRDVSRLLAAHGSVNAPALHGWTALHLAAFWGHEDVVEVLLANGADVNSKDVNGRRPIDMAEANGDESIAEMLRAHGSTRSDKGRAEKAPD